ncbi:T9SS type A sorting domain-containing protein [Neolewinella antarctica]|uniref:Secretion system C-terminal sorting domain-containing protein n=1 Tax=Neolewinella antarctica TaxID=442734 RepID=A0ABX0XC88_9BACT|nr:T9SS type A sorting domain-containing protein [Neolewinella antarctica]NJC26891.1 hypothetical protein [Neolewinella antarctica]
MHIRLLLVLQLFMFGVADLVGQFTFVEADGIVRVDAESTGELGEWEKRSGIEGFIGDGYLEYTGGNKFNNPGTSLLSYKVRITTTGTYRIRWRSRITAPGERTEFNDSWLRVPDATLFYAEKADGSRVFPKGSGLMPVPEGSGSGGWFKVYQNRADQWTWQTSTNDNDPFDIYATFDAPGDYTVEISGRSKGHAIDRFVLARSGVASSLAEDLTQPESARATTSVISREAQPLRVAPNPATDHLTISLPDDLTAGSYQIVIHDFSGQQVHADTLTLRAGMTHRIRTEHLPPGAYALSVSSAGTLYRTKFTR